MSDHNMPNEAQDVNHIDKRSTIIRVVHNRENPYVQLNKQALWDERLSLKAVGLWGRCMSRPNNWKFCITELVKKCKEGRKAIDSAMKELIKCGYAHRIEFHDRSPDGKFSASGIEYVFFEFPATEEEKKEQEEIFKKNFQHCRYGNSRYGNFRNGELLIIDPNDNHSSMNKSEETPPTPSRGPAAEAAGGGSKKSKIIISQEARDLYPLFVKVITDHMPDYVLPKKTTAILEQLHQMLHQDNRTADDILKTLEWGLNDNIIRGDWKGWSPLLLVAKNPAAYLRTKFNGIKTASKQKKERKFLPCSDDNEAKRIAKEMADRAI